MSSLLSALYFLLVKQLTAVNDLESFSVTIDSGGTANTAGTVNIIVWFNFTVYTYTLPGSNVGQTYTAYKSIAPFFTTLGTSNCHKPEYNNVPESKILIENSNSDAVAITSAKITTKSGTYYQWDSICIQNNLINYSTGRTCLTYCSGCDANNMGIYGRLCVDRDTNDCGPSRQIVYFDTQYPNQAITNANWADGSSVYPNIITCEPTVSPTAPTTNPSKNPTNYPTISPTNPTYTPSATPSKFPTLYPTLFPTISPTTQNPSKMPTNIPTLSPVVTTKYPSEYPSNHPSNHPTKSPVSAQDGSVQDSFVTTDGDSSVENDEKLIRNANNSLIIYIIIAAVFCLCTGVIVMFVCRQRHQKRKQKIQKMFRDMNTTKTAGSNEIQSASPTVSVNNIAFTFPVHNNNGHTMPPEVAMVRVGSMSSVGSPVSDNELNGVSTNNYPTTSDNEDVLVDVNSDMMTPGNDMEENVLRSVGSLKDGDFIIGDENDQDEMIMNSNTKGYSYDEDDDMKITEGMNDTQLNTNQNINENVQDGDDEIVNDIEARYETAGQ